ATAASVGGSNTVPQASPKVMSENLLQLIASTVSNMKIDETQTTIVLQETAELPGKVTLEVRMSNGALEVNFNTSDPESLATLQNNILALRSQLQKLSATSVEIFFAGQSPEDKSSDFDDSKSEIGTDSKTGRSNERDGKDKVQGKQQSGGAQQ
ncbi:MAG: flagellar hook-length control protein FliK, partial [Verrucomicrobia bacterium]|nr:flagellar hook-length control protein FliK [Verrucomicrobiota bacterium]